MPNFIEELKAEIEKLKGEDWSERILAVETTISNFETRIAAIEKAVGIAAPVVEAAVEVATAAI